MHTYTKPSREISWHMYDAGCNCSFGPFLASRVLLQWMCSLTMGLMKDALWHYVYSSNISLACRMTSCVIQITVHWHTEHTHVLSLHLSDCVVLFQLWVSRWNWISFRRNSGQPADRYTWMHTQHNSKEKSKQRVFITIYDNGAEFVLVYLNNN